MIGYCAGGCGRRVIVDLIICEHCDAALPPDLTDKINSAIDRFDETRPDTVDDLAEAYDAAVLWLKGPRLAS
jgi:hypothetical protein